MVKVTLFIFHISLVSAFESTRHYCKRQSTLARDHLRKDVQKRVSLAASTSSDTVEDAVTVEFPPPLSTVDRLKRAAKFWSSAVPIVLSYYSLYAERRLRESLLGESMSEDEAEVRPILNQLPSLIMNSTYILLHVF
jgi:hypothetical protein